MAIESITITDPKDSLIYDIARQQHMQEGADLPQAQSSIRMAVEAGKNVTIVQEMNTRAILELVIDGKKVISKLPPVTEAAA